MSDVKGEILNIIEKVGDQVIKADDLDILGLSVPSTLEEVGLVGLVIPAIKGISYINEALFSKAFLKFHSEIANLSDEHRLKFFNKYSRKQVQEFGEQAMLLLNKIEMMLAAKMLGKAHYLLACGQINEDTYYNYGFIIKNLNPHLFKNIVKLFRLEDSSQKFEGGLYLTLSSLGIMNEADQKLYPGSLPKTEFKISEFGHQFYNEIVSPFSDDI